LAAQLAYTYSNFSYVSRFRDAMAVLDSFPDQQNPKIRAARGEILHDHFGSSARAVQGYGPAAGLSGYAAYRRRRLWWRSAGPIGQLRVRLADRRLGPWPIPDDQSAVRADAESETVARLLDSLDGLSSAAALERVEQALQQFGRLPSLLLTQASLD